MNAPTFTRTLPAEVNAVGDVLARYETMPARLFDKIIWAEAERIVIDERGPRPVPQTRCFERVDFPTLATTARASAELDVLSAALAWDRAKSDAYRRLAKAGGFNVTDTGLVPVASRGEA